MHCMGFLRDMVRTLRVTRKPEAKVYRGTLRIVVLGFLLLGSLGFTFQIVSSSFQMVRVAPVSRDVATIVLAALAAIVLGVVLYLRRRAAF